jgi:hypothetical protein
MKRELLWFGVPCVLAMGVFPVVHAQAPEPIVLRPVAPTLVEVAPTPIEPATSMQAEDDPWYPPMRALVEQLSDAYFDKPHTTALGMSAGEMPSGRELRLNSFTRDVLAAVRDRAGELAQFGPDAAWDYAATLMWIAHRETRICSNPAKLGNEDNGKAAGPWQMWEQPGHPADRFQASSALDLLIRDAHAWYLPMRQPWLGYPECARWVAAHPMPRE